MPDINTPNQAEGTTQPQEIIIDVQNSLYAKHFSKTQLIHGDEFNTLKNAIKSRISNLENNSGNSTDNDTEERRSEAYTVLGTRGSGKSSFLYSLIHWCKNEEEKNKIQVLDLIDPTLFEDKGHILLTIIAQLNHLVIAKLQEQGLSEASGSLCQKWQKQFKSLARGIPSIKGGDFIKDNWMEPEFVMSQGVQNVYSAYTLENDFNKCVDLALGILNKTLLIIIFDDIDIDFRKGWEVLETVRKYLTSRQIFVIISGDAKLFSKSIRKVQWKNFGKALLKNEAENGQKEVYNNLVTEMESQYMQKVMPTQYRINLKSLLDIENTTSDKVKVGEIGIRTYYNKNLFQGYEAENPVQIKVFVDFLLSMPLRTQMQLLNAFNRSADQPKNLVMPFVSHLLDNGINYEDLLRFPNKLNAIILKFLVNNKIVEESYQLQPNTLDTDINACLVALSLISSKHYTKNSYLIFDYIVRVGFLRFVKYNCLHYTPDDEKKDSLGAIDGFVKHSHLYNEVDLKVLIGNAIAYLDGLKYGGFTKIYGLKEKAKDGSEIKRIDTVFPEDKSLERALGFLPLTISAYTSKQSSELNYSVVALLAVITDIVREASVRTKEGENIVNSDRGKTIIEFLNYLSQTRNYIIPAKEQSAGGVAESNDINGFSIDESEEELKTFITEFSKWIDEYKGIILPPYLLGKIATRAFASINSLDKSKDKKLGEAMHRRIVVLLNAVLVEEAREYGYNLNNNNPSGNDKIFVDNLKKFKKINGNDDIGFDCDKLKLFKWIVQCPLLLAYMNLPAEGSLTVCFERLSATPIVSIYGLINDVDVKQEVNKIAFSANSPKCKKIVSKHFSTPGDLFSGANDEQVVEKLKKYFNPVNKRSVVSFRKKYETKPAW